MTPPRSASPPIVSLRGETSRLRRRLVDRLEVDLDLHLLAGGQIIDRIIRQLNPRTNPAAIFVVGPELALGALALALGVALLAGFLPARRAMRMSALSALRYE